MPKADGSPADTAKFSQAEGGTAVLLRVEGMDESSYGFHIHAMGKCDPNSTSEDKPGKMGDFLSAGAYGL